MGGNKIIKQASKVGFYALKKIDGLVASATASGAYIKAVEEKGGTVDLNNPDPQAITEAQLMMRRTQSSPFPKDAPSILTQGELTGNVSVDKLLLQFQSFMLNRWSLIKHDMWQAGKHGDVAQAFNIATWLTLATAAETGLRELTRSFINSLTDKKKPKANFVNDFAINMLQNVPVVSQGIGALTYGSVPVPALSVIVRGFDELSTAAKSKSMATKAKHYEKAAMIVIGTGFGIPGTMQASQLIGNKK
jgi:hypothetical protein